MEKPVGSLTINHPVSILFSPQMNSNFESLFIRFGTFCKANDSSIYVSILENNKIIDRWNIHASLLKDNAFHEFKFNKEVIVKKETTWKLSISSNASSNENAVSLFYENNTKSQKFKVAKTEIKGNVCFDFKTALNLKTEEYKHEGSMGLISVIIPCYNCSLYLDRCLESLLNQTYNFIEPIIIDDFSKDRDKTKEIINKYKDKFNIPIAFIENEENKGAPATRNIGYEKSKGEFLFFLDADTYLDKSIFEKMIQVLHSNFDCSYAYCKFRWGNKTVESGPFREEALKRANFASMMSLIRRIDFPKSGLDENLKRYQDWDLWLRLLKDKKIGIWINEYLFDSEVREGSISNGGSISDQETREILAIKHPWANILLN